MEGCFGALRPIFLERDSISLREASYSESAFLLMPIVIYKNCERLPVLLFGNVNFLGSMRIESKQTLNLMSDPK